MRVAVIPVLLALAAIGSGCSGGGKSGTSTVVPATSDATSTAGTQVADDFRPDALTAIVLQPSDVPAGLAQTNSFSKQYGGDVISYGASYADDTITIESSIGHAAPGATIGQAIIRLREIQVGLIKGEHNYTIDGADQAFLYTFPETFAVSTLVIKDGYYAHVLITAGPKAHGDEIHNQDTLDRYTKVVFDRLKAYIASPSSVTPVPGTPRYDTTASKPD